MIVVAEISSQKDNLSAERIFFSRKLWKKVLFEKSFLVEIYVRDKLRRFVVLAQRKKVCYKVHIERKGNIPRRRNLKT